MSISLEGKRGGEKHARSRWILWPGNISHEGFFGCEWGGGDRILSYYEKVGRQDDDFKRRRT